MTDYTTDAAAEAEAEHIFDPADEIQMTPRRGPMSTLAVRLDGADIDRLRVAAAEQGIGVTRLVRQWLTERLDDKEPMETVVITAAELRRFIRSHSRSA